MSRVNREQKKAAQRAYEREKAQQLKKPAEKKPQAPSMRETAGLTLPLSWNEGELESALKLKGVHVDQSPFATWSKFAIDLSEREARLKPAIQSPDAALKEITIGNDIVKKAPLLGQELEKIGRKKDFKVRLRRDLAVNEQWLGNTHTVLADGRVYFHSLANNSRDANSLISKIMTMNDLAKSLDGYVPAFAPDASHLSVVQGITKDRVEQLESPGTYKIGKCLLEAGNVRPAIKKNGEYGVIIGTLSLYMSLLWLDHNKEFLPQLIEQKIAAMKREPDYDKRVQDTEQRLAGAYEVVEQSIRPKLKLERYFSALDALKKYYPAPSADVSSDELRARAEVFLAKRELTKEAIAADLEIDLGQITFVDQPYAFHLDLIMREHPKHGLVVHNGELALKLLDYLKTVSNVNSFYGEDLNDYIAGEQERLREGGDRIAKLRTQLKDSGYEVYDAPAVFARPVGTQSRYNPPRSVIEDLISTDDHDELNLLNGISFADRDSKSCLIAFGGNAVPVAQAAALYLTRNGIFDEIHLLGQPNDNKGGQYHTGHVLNKQGGGLKCMSYETRNPSPESN